MSQLSPPMVPPSPSHKPPAKETARFQIEPPARLRVADHVFETLARAILTGELTPGEPLATQRDLAQQFNISALVVRQAIHRLEDLGLVRVKQGSTTIVLDPNESADIRLIQLRMELAEPGAGLSGAALENQALFIVPMLVLAERRMTSDEVAQSEALVAALPESPTTDQMRLFRVAYWQGVSRATRNPLFQQQVRWWSTMVGQLDRRGHAMRLPSQPINVAMYQRLNRALRERKGAVQVYLESIAPFLQRMDEELASLQKK
jgi:GntR family transcriptional regulator, transcriptional repressor for pyruvate dehydrogenase complex